MRFFWCTRKLKKIYIYYSKIFSFILQVGMQNLWRKEKTCALLSHSGESWLEGIPVPCKMEDCGSKTCDFLAWFSNIIPLALCSISRSKWSYVTGTILTRVMHYYWQLGNFKTLPECTMMVDGEYKMIWRRRKRKLYGVYAHEYENQTNSSANLDIEDNSLLDRKWDVHILVLGMWWVNTFPSRCGTHNVDNDLTILLLPFAARHLNPLHKIGQLLIPSLILLMKKTTMMLLRRKWIWSHWTHIHSHTSRDHDHDDRHHGIGGDHLDFPRDSFDPFHPLKGFRPHYERRMRTRKGDYLVDPPHPQYSCSLAKIFDTRTWDNLPCRDEILLDN